MSTIDEILRKLTILQQELEDLPRPEGVSGTGISGSGTSGRLAVFTAATVIGNSQIEDSIVGGVLDLSAALTANRIITINDVSGRMTLGAGTITSGTANDATIVNHLHALDNSGVVAAVYGDATHVGAFIVDVKGRITTAADVLITGVTPSAHAGTHANGGGDAVDHNTLTNSVANEHIDHTAVTLTAGAGMTGTGDISANRTFAVGAGNGIAVNANDVALDINGLAAAGIAAGDFVPFWDLTAVATNKKITFANFEGTLAHNNLVAGTIVSHDTGATGAELDSLTDNSIVNTLHRHSELVASDGAPDPALSVDALGNVGIGTPTIPHGGVGRAIFAIDGPDASAVGPHVQFTTDADDYPLLQTLNHQHDNVALNFDSYFDGSWRSSDAGSNFQIYKLQDLLRFRYDSGIAQGAELTWNEGIAMDTGGHVGIGTSVPIRLTDIYDNMDNSAVEPNDYTGGLMVRNVATIANAYSSIGLAGWQNDYWYINALTHANNDVDLVFGRQFSGDASFIPRMTLNALGNVGVNEISPVAKLDVNQSGASAAIPVVKLYQQDVSEPFIWFKGTAAAGPQNRSIIEYELPWDPITWLKVYVEDLGNQVPDEQLFLLAYRITPA